MKYNVIRDSKKFYCGKQEDYSKYRPPYPNELFDFLRKESRITKKLNSNITSSEIKEAKSLVLAKNN